MLHQCELGEAEHEDFGAGILELDCGFGIEARALNGLYYTPAKTLVKNCGANSKSIDDG